MRPSESAGRSERVGPRGRHRNPFRCRCRARGDSGYVTAETAVVIPVLVALAALLVWGLMAGAAQVRCVDAARAGAREAARSGETAAAVQAARAAAPGGAEVSVERSGGMVRVRVTVPLPRFPVPLGSEADALDEAALESGASGPGTPEGGAGP
ncbi:pilus assembly protein [Streptomyces sp. NBC_01476]|uniref:TadE family type IV pilus minor pilin n=1 Tax=Streptomyces sp. NBC_01476 TaxID=2903881 RepID=UPI002E31BCA8|nr:TadE family type IV pilus minor pilin [Streptomyces sp. NBC_01476]